MSDIETGIGGLEIWRDRNLSKAVNRIALPGREVAYRPDLSDGLVVVVKDFQFNSYPLQSERVLKEVALKDSRGEHFSAVKVSFDLGFVALRSRFFPIHQGSLSIGSNTEAEDSLSRLTYTRLPKSPSKGNFYVRDGYNELQLDPENLLAILKSIKTDRQTKPYALTPQELNNLANRHRKVVEKLDELHKFNKINESDSVFNVWNYEFRSNGSDSLEIFDVFVNHRYDDKKSFEIFQTQFGPTISYVTEARHTSEGVPYGDLNSLRQPIDESLLVTLSIVLSKIRD